MFVHMKAGFVVLDPGEDFIGQVRQKYGRENTNFVLRNVQIIWISHTHGDQCLGRHQLLYERVKVTTRVIIVCVNEQLIAERCGRERLIGPNFFKVDFAKLDATV
jgi:glyoxylase-like metal-dependent hydrolase (beta-lactamase superfamily II)